MRINEILTESQLQQLEEGPKLDAFGRGVGKVVGGVAKGVGAVAGGVRGAFTALKKGYQTGKAIVGDDPDPNAGSPGYTAPADPKAAPTPAPVADPKAVPTPAPPSLSTTTVASGISPHMMFLFWEAILTQKPVGVEDLAERKPAVRSPH